jgi:iron complex outermembrane recepter protein
MKTLNPLNLLNPNRPRLLAHTIAVLAASGALHGAAHAQADTEKKTDALETVVVTAQRVSQLASKTPIALTALSPEELRSAGATTAVNLTNLVPNVLISAGSSASTDISIRGIASTNTTEVGDPAAAFHIDGIYLGRPQSAGATFYDLARVEVLRGPQGTLYGRNATAGAINLITNKPDKKFAAEVNADMGNYNRRNIEALVNVPVNDLLALRAVVSSTVRDGYLVTASAANGFSKNRDDANNLSGRVHALFSVSPATQVLLTADFNRNKGVGNGSVSLATYQTQTGAAQRTQLGNRNEGIRDEEATGLTVEVTHKLGFADLTYLGGARTYDRDSASSTLGITSKTVSGFKQSSHELRLASADAKAPLTWVAGVYLFDERGDIDGTFGSIPITPAIPTLFGVQRFQQDPVTSKSQALFGQATYKLTPAARLTAGLRYTQDEKARTGVQSLTVPPPLAQFSNTAVNKAKVDYTQTTWKLGGEFDLSPTTLLYAHAATGYKAGGYFDGDNARGDNTYRPELLTSYEAGIKGRFLDNRVRLAASVFRYDYKDLQVSYITINPLTNATGTITTNAARATNQGLELEGKWLVSDNGALNFAVGLLDAKYKSFIFPVVTGRPVAIDFAGKKLDKAPSANITLGYMHEWSLGDGGGMTAYLGTRRSAAYVLSNFAIAAPVQYEQKAFNRSDISLAYNAPRDKWYAQLYARNLEAKNVMTGLTFSTLTGTQVLLAEPRVFGVRAGLKF